MKPNSQIKKRAGRRNTGNVKLEHIAKDCNLSISTVSRVINGRTDTFPLAKETIQRVHESAHRLGYRPNRLARAIAYGRTNLIGLSIPHHRTDLAHEAVSEDAYFTAQIFGLLASGILDNPKSLDYDLVIHDRRKFRNTGNHYDAFQTDLLDGMIYCNPTTNSIQFIQSLPGHFPVVILGYAPELADRVVSVDIDNRLAASACIDHLVKIGRKRILIVMPSNLEHYLCIIDRLHGYIKEITRHRLPFSEEQNICSIPQTKEAAVDWAKSFQELHHYDAIVTPTDEMALFIMSALQSRGIQIPKQVALIGFSDSSRCENGQPPLTSVKMPFHEMGYRSAELLIDILSDKTTFKPSHHVVPTDLIIRQSTSPNF